MYITDEQATSMAVLLNYLANRSRIIPEENVSNYIKIVQEKIGNMNGNIHGAYSLDGKNLIYRKSYDQFGKSYVILRDNINIDEAIKAFLLNAPTQHVIAAYNEDALSALNLELVNGTVAGKTMYKTRNRINL